jgi:hypothetical protein
MAPSSLISLIPLDALVFFTISHARHYERVRLHPRTDNGDSRWQVLAD